VSEPGRVLHRMDFLYVRLSSPGRHERWIATGKVRLVLSNDDPGRCTTGSTQQGFSSGGKPVPIATLSGETTPLQGTRGSFKRAGLGRVPRRPWRGGACRKEERSAQDGWGSAFHAIRRATVLVISEEGGSTPSEALREALPHNRARVPSLCDATGRQPGRRR